MLKIGEFSKLSQTTIKALRFYEKEALLPPAFVDEWTGYRFYETSQLETAAKIRSFRQLGLSIEEIRSILSGTDARKILSARAERLKQLQRDAARQLSVIEFLLEGKQMKYQVTMKEIPEMIVYTAETTLPRYSDSMQWIPSLGQECLALNPNLRCAEPPYEFCEYPDGEYQETNVRIRHSEAVTAMGIGNEHITFRTLPAAKVLSIYHKGPYDTIGQAYAFLMKYAETSGCQIAGLSRECYIDGIWNQESPENWLTEIQLPIE